MTTNKPLTPNTVIADLLDGSRFVVHSIYPAKASDKEWTMMPDTVVHVWPITRLAEPELTELRAKARYAPSEFPYHLQDVVFFPAAA